MKKSLLQKIRTVFFLSCWITGCSVSGDCNIFVCGPGIGGVPAKHKIESLVWSPDGSQLALIDNYDYNPHKRFDYNMYLWNFKDSSLKKIQENPLEITDYSLFQWVSEDTLLSGNSWNMYQVNRKGQFQTQLQTVKEKHNIHSGCLTFSTQDLIISAYGESTSIQVPVTKDNQTYEIPVTLYKLFVHPSSSKTPLFELKLENQPEFKAHHFGSFVSCSPFSNHIYFNYADINSTQTQHVVAELNTKQNQLVNPIVLLTHKPVSNSGSESGLPHFKFVGWKNENTVIYFYKAEKDPKISFYEFNLTDKTSKKWSDLSEKVINQIEQKGVYNYAPDFQKVGVFTFSPDFQKVAYVDQKADKLMLSDLSGNNSQTLLDIQKDFSRE